MRFVKASERLPEFISDSLYIRNIKTKGQVEPGYFRSYAGKSDGWELENFEWMDESDPPPSSGLDDEAETLYPDPDWDTFGDKCIHDIVEAQRSAHITCARQYIDTIEKLRAENENLRHQHNCDIVNVAAKVQQEMNKIIAEKEMKIEKMGKALEEIVDLSIEIGVVNWEKIHDTATSALK